MKFLKQLVTYTKTIWNTVCILGPAMYEKVEAHHKSLYICEFY